MILAVEVLNSNNLLLLSIKSIFNIALLELFLLTSVKTTLKKIVNRNTEHECVLEVLKRSDKLNRGTEA